MIRLWSPLVFRFNYCSRFSRSRYLFFLYKLFYNPHTLWTLFNVFVLRKHLWVRFVKRNYVYYLRCLHPLKWNFHSHKRSFYFLQSTIFFSFHILFCIISTTFSFLLNRLFWLLFYFYRIRVHFFFIRNLSFPTAVFANNQTNLLLKKITLSSWSTSYFYNYFFSKLYKAFTFRFFVVKAYEESWAVKSSLVLVSVPHYRNLVRIPSYTNYSRLLYNFLASPPCCFLLLVIEVYIVIQRMIFFFCK